MVHDRWCRGRGEAVARGLRRRVALRGDRAHRALPSGGAGLDRPLAAPEEASAGTGIAARTNGC